MKKLLFLYLTLAAQLGFVVPAAAQKYTSVRAVITPDVAGATSYTVITDVPKDYYGRGESAQKAFNAAVKKGEWNLITLDGCKIAKGTVPPADKPNCSTAVCTLSVSVNSLTLSCDQTGALTAVSPQPGVSYEWTGPGGQTVSGNPLAVGRNTNGTSAYTVKAIKTGCTSQTAVGRLTVSNCQSETITGAFSYQVPTTATPWSYTSTQPIGFQNIPVGAVDFMENEFLRLEVRQGLGCLFQIYDKISKKWVINSPDLGRGDGPSSYTQSNYTDRAAWVDKDGHRPFAKDGPAPAPGPWFTGWNPLKDGDFAGHPATILFHARAVIDGFEWIYVRTQLNSWSHDNDRLMPVILHQYVRLDGNKVPMHFKLVQNRTDDLTDYGPYLQEWCLMMVNGNQTQAVYYNGDAPYTSAGVTNSPGYERYTASEGYVIKDRVFPISEPWIGVRLRGDSERMIAQYDPHLYYPSYNHMDPHEGSDCDGCKEGMYTSGHQLSNLDAKGTWYFDVTWIVGTVNDVRQFVYAQPRNTVPNFYFNQNTQRNGWVGFNGVTDPQMPNAASAAGWPTKWLGKTDNGQTNIDNSFLISPRTSFRAVDCPTLYVKAKLTSTSLSSMRVEYTYVGQEREIFAYDPNYPSENAKRFPKGPRETSQKVNFSLTPNNQMQTVAIPMNWGGGRLVSVFDIWFNGSSMPGGASGPELTVQYIGCTNPN